MLGLTKWQCKSLWWLFLFFLGGSIYGLVEIAWRGFTHVTMLPVGGLCVVMLAAISRLRVSLGLQSVIGTASITAVEFAAGCVINLHWGLRVWDYSKEPLNILGQVCPRYSFYWLFLSAAAIVLFRLAAHLYEGIYLHRRRMGEPAPPQV